MAGLPARTGMSRAGRLFQLMDALRANRRPVTAAAFTNAQVWPAHQAPAGLPDLRGRLMAADWAM